MMRFIGKVVFVTGAARGIGRATAEGFAAEGAIVFATDIDQVALAEVADTNIHIRRQDVTDEVGWAALIAEITALHGGLDILVNNAGMAVLAAIEDTSLEVWRRTLAVNLESVFLGTRAGVAAMKVRGGVIVNVASIAGNVAEPMLPAYNASKGGVKLFTKSVAVDCARRGIPVRINSVHPGYTETALVGDAVAKLGDRGPGFIAATAAQIPLGRLATPQEIARPILFLCSDDAAYMVGSELVVDGGYIAA